MESPRRSLICIALLAPLLACMGTASELLGGPPPEPIIAPGTPAAPGSAQTGPCADCLLLLEHDFDTLLAGSYCQLCGDAEAKECRSEWLGELSCGRYDWLRNCIYARLGYGFAGSDWREVFDDEAWYEPDPEFTWSRVSPVQARNAKTLQRLVDQGRCTP